MAAALVVPETTRVNRPIDVEATGFAADGTLRVSIDELNVHGSFLLDASGDLVAPNGLSWAPSKEGAYTIRATDGTDTVTTRVQVYSTT